MTNQTNPDNHPGKEQAMTVIRNMHQNINASYFASLQEALESILGMIPPGTKVARGDSATINQVGIMPALVRRGQNTVLDPYRWDADGNYIDSLEDRRQMQREAFLSDVFLAGTNAVTLDGKLVNVDYLGNRVAAMLFGPKKVIIVAGVNKIVANIDEAMARIRRIAAPSNARRHYRQHHYQEWSDLPCVITGKCIDCRHHSRICSYTVIIESTGARDKGRINLALIGEELGI